jgi:F0F1-type ATP synthase membrane subunit b/b'
VNDMKAIEEQKANERKSYDRLADDFLRQSEQKVAQARERAQALLDEARDKARDEAMRESKRRQDIKDNRALSDLDRTIASDAIDLATSLFWWVVYLPWVEC